MGSSLLSERTLELLYKYVFVFNTCTLVIGLVGNVIALAVILSSKSFHNLTGFYLLSLSVADLLILVTSSSHITKVNFFLVNEIVHNIMEWIFQTSVIVSTLTIMAFTVERYLAICHPFYVQSLPKKSRVKRIVIAIWSIAALLALLPVAQNIIYMQFDNEKLQLTNEAVMLNTYIIYVWVLLYFFIPMSVITVMYVLIWLKLWKSSSGGKTPDLHVDRAVDTRTIVMFVIIVATFILSWEPFYTYKILWLHTLRLKLNYRFDVNAYVSINKLIFMEAVQLVTYPLSSTLNPIIYLMVSRKFYEAFKVLLSKMSQNLIRWSVKFTRSLNKSKPNTLETVA